MMMIFMMVCSGDSSRCTVSVFSDNEDVEGRVVDEDDDCCKCDDFYDDV